MLFCPTKGERALTIDNLHLRRFNSVTEFYVLPSKIAKEKCRGFSTASEYFMLSSVSF